MLNRYKVLILFLSVLQFKWESIMIIEELKKDNIEAMRNKDSVRRGIYSVVLNKIMLENIKKREINETLSEVEVISIMQKTIKELKDECENYKKVNNSTEVANIELQIKTMEKYLPTMMSAQEIKNIILNLPDKTTPFVMKHFKQEYAGKCDMKLVSEVLRSL